MTRMSKENARRLAARQELDRLKISLADVDEYREVHYPGSRARDAEARARGIVAIPGDGYIAQFSHERFHEWFGTECDDTCPHRRRLPAEIARRPWWKRLLGIGGDR